MRVIADGASDTGQVREANEDCFAALDASELPPGVDALLIVADGMGGHQAGDVASELVVRHLVDELSQAAPTRLKTSEALLEAIERAILEAHARVRAAAATPRYRGMGTTVTVAALAAGRLHLGHVGDSRAYLIRGGRIQQLSADHSWVAEQVRAGLIDPADAEAHEDRNVLTRAVGVRARLTVDTSIYPVARDDVILLCSDGLHGVVPDEEIRAVVATYGQPSVAAHQLVGRANAAGGPDNVTAVVARIVDAGDANGSPGDDGDATRVIRVTGRPRGGRRSVGRAPRLVNAVLLAFAVGLALGLLAGGAAWLFGWLGPAAGMGG